MQLSSILSACARNGVTVTQPCPERKGNPYYVLRKGNNVLEFYTNSDGYVGHLTYRHPDTDAMTDLFMDSYFHTIKSAMHFLNPSGEIVRQHGSATPAKPVNPDDVPNDIQVSKNEEKGGIEIKFNEKPNESVRQSLRDKKFQYSPFFNVWWKKFNDTDYQWAISSLVKLPVSA